MFEVLEHPDLSSKPTPGTDLPPRLTNLVALPANSVTKVPVREMLVLEAIALLRQEAEIYRYNAGYPEYAYFSIRKLRAFGNKS